MEERKDGDKKCPGPKPVTILTVTSEEFRKDTGILKHIGSHLLVKIVSESGAVMTISGCADLDECRGCLDCDFKQPEYIYKTLADVLKAEADAEEDADKESIVCELESALSCISEGNYESAAQFLRTAMALVDEKRLGE